MILYLSLFICHILFVTMHLSYWIWHNAFVIFHFLQSICPIEIAILHFLPCILHIAILRNGKRALSQCTAGILTSLMEIWTYDSRSMEPLVYKLSYSVMSIVFVPMHLFHFQTSQTASHKLYSQISLFLPSTVWAQFSWTELADTNSPTTREVWNGLQLIL